MKLKNYITIKFAVCKNRLIFNKLASLVFLGLLLSAFVEAQTIVVTNPVSPFSVPGGVTSLTVEVWGGGGGGGGIITTLAANKGGGGGGGGAYNTSTFAVTSGQAYTITKGAGGTAGPIGLAGGTGGTSTVSGVGGTISAAGGGGGGGSTGGNGSSGGAGSGLFSGGAGGASSGNGAGGGGGAGNNGNGTAGANAGTGTGGSGNPAAPPYIGGNGGAFTTANANGNPGISPSGGGGGGRCTAILSSKSGGAGAAGQVVLTYTIPPACSGAPAGGTTLSSVNLVCPGINFTLSITGNTSTAGISYQWQSSPDNITYANISGATAQTLVISQASATYYSCLVTCTNSSLTASSAYKLVTMNSFLNCYCTPTHASGSGCNLGGLIDGLYGKITNVTFNTLNNSTGCPGNPYYTLYPASGITTTSVTQGTAYTFSVTSFYNNSISVWIDWNQDGVFATTEWYNLGSNSSITTWTGTQSITIPVGPTGQTRMRVSSELYSNTNASTSACAAYTYGETEDYVINVMPQVCINNPATPSNGSTMCPAASTMLSWPSLFSATGYDVFFGTVNPAVTLVSSNQPGNTYTTGALTGGTYYWSILPHLPSGGAVSCSTWTIIINEEPVPAASSNAPVCNGLNLTLFGNNLAGGQATGNTYAWTGPNTFTSSLQNPSIASANSANSGVYYLIVTNQSGCTASASHAVIVNANPLLNIAALIDVSCNGFSDGSIDIDATNGTPGYLFDLDGNSTLDGIYSGLAAGNYTVTVIDDNGCEAIPLLVILDEPDQLTVEAGSNSPVCTGTSLNLNSTPSGGTSGFNYSWTGPNSFASTAQNPSINSATTAATGQYDLQITDAHGCLADYYTSVTVNALATAAVSNFGNNNVCMGQPATVQLACTGAANWNYTLSDGTQTISGTAATSPVNINIIPITAGTHNYTVTTISDANCSSGGALSGTATVHVSTLPPGNNAGAVNGPGEACAGTVSLVTVNTIGGQNIRYSWNTGTNSSVVLFSTDIAGPFSPGPFQTTANSVYAQYGNLAGSSGYSICTQGINGCGSTNNKCTWVRGIVSVPGTITPANAIACANEVKNYNCGVSAGATVYNWTLAGSAIPITSGQGSQNVQVTFPVVFTSGQLCVTAALSCGGSSTSAPRCMNISNTPVVPGAFTSGPSKVCPGATGVVFSVPAVAGVTGYNWTTPVGTTITSGQNTPSITVNFPNPYTGAPPVCVSATSACASGVGRCKTVGSNIPGQPGSLAGPTTNICNATVQYSISNITGSTGYTWTNPAGTTIMSGQASTTILLSVSPGFVSGPLTVVATTNLCTPGTGTARTITIIGKPNTPAAITAFPGAWCNGGFANFSITPVSPLPTYNWTVSNGTITGGQGTNNIDVTWGTGTGNVNVTAGNGCGTSGIRSQSFSSSCREEDGELSVISYQLSVYPNPAHDMITISINAKEKSGLTLQLTDITGRVVLSENQSATEGSNTYQLGLTHLSKGVYMLDVKSGAESWKTKLAVE